MDLVPILLLHVIMVVKPLALRVIFYNRKSSVNYLLDYICQEVNRV